MYGSMHIAFKRVGRHLPHCKKGSNWKFHCGVCERQVRSRDAGVYCEVCQSWVHCKCASVSTRHYEELQQSEGGWCCIACEHSALPFADCSSISISIDDFSEQDPMLNSSLPTAAKSRISGLFSIFYSNCRSILPKMDDLRYLVSCDNPPTIIALVETWLDSDVSNSEVSLPTYRLFHRDRTRQGGGVALYVHESVTIKTTSKHPSCELLSITFDTPLGNLLVATMYRPPGTDTDLTELNSALLSLKLHEHTQAVITGDLNVNLLPPYSHTALELQAIVAGYGLTQVVDQATRVTSTSSTLIDLRNLKNCYMYPFNIMVVVWLAS